VKIDLEKCIGCGECVQVCPLHVIRLKRKKALVQEGCSACGACLRVCPQEAVAPDADVPPNSVRCEACPIGCQIRPCFMGACQRYRNENGKLMRIVPLHAYSDVAQIVGPEPMEQIRQPLLTGIGAGTTYPDCKPAPHIVQARRGDVDVVTVVTEAPLSYSSVMVKIDTDIPIGEEGAQVFAGKKAVGRVITEQYGSKMLSVGGVNLLTGPDGFVVARTTCDIANRKAVKLRVEGGSKLELQVGQPPLIDGEEARKMRVGCGSATMGLFAPLLREVADEVIVLDSHLTGLMSEHAAGRFVGVRPTGIRLKFRQSTPGRYFGDHGPGWGGTSITDPVQVIASLDIKIARSGMRILITETTGQNAAMYELTEEGLLRPIPLTDDARAAVGAISSSCEPSRVSAMYMGGAGGSARAGVVRYPVKLTQAVHTGEAHLTVGGAPTFLLPGGGISFLVDVQRVKPGSFYWTPTPATICPIEYTMRVEDYERMGGHVEAMKPFDAAKPRLWERPCGP
jgi:6-hydroxynicotinate reductase